ncbi:Hpt domain-containing protein [Candidatus Photodesmus blepharus]|uniref:Hpt domain-containing protein n=1 Tax=Candidatus Photodesmus blepharonis TaxID=1179155 RepID=UPI0005539FCF|nr:Hpt domain-containing protein [Candidatus Photodesmus blepharus]
MKARIEIDILYVISVLGGDKCAVERLLDVFVQNHADDAYELSNLLRNKNMEEALRKIHSLKGIAGHLGSVKLKMIADQIEMDMKNEFLVSEIKLVELQEILSATVESAQNYLISK